MSELRTRVGGRQLVLERQRSAVGLYVWVGRIPGIGCPHCPPLQLCTHHEVTAAGSSNGLGVVIGKLADKTQGG